MAIKQQMQRKSTRMLLLNHFDRFVDLLASHSFVHQNIQNSMLRTAKSASYKVKRQAFCFESLD